MLVSWYAGQKFHEIYRFDHPDLTPKKPGCMDARYSDFDATAEYPAACSGTLSLERAAKSVAAAPTKLAANVDGTIRVTVPAFTSAVEIYDLQGRLLGTHSCERKAEASEVSIRGSFQKGVLQVRPVF